MSGRDTSFYPSYFPTLHTKGQQLLQPLLWITMCFLWFDMHLPCTDVFQLILGCICCVLSTYFSSMEMQDWLIGLYVVYKCILCNSFYSSFYLIEQILNYSFSKLFWLFLNILTIEFRITSWFQVLLLNFYLKCI